MLESAAYSEPWQECRPRQSLPTSLAHCSLLGDRAFRVGNHTQGLITNLIGTAAEAAEMTASRTAPGVGSRPKLGFMSVSIHSSRLFVHYTSRLSTGGNEERVNDNESIYSV